ncbi:MAG: hypothetical protein E7172_03110 [Firmicutes bacterium]|nr:hypothetical protein [Bacillota bacterium]
MKKDRKDGKYLQAKDGIHAIIPYLMENRCEAEVFQSLNLDITNLKYWVDQQNVNLDFKYTYFQALTAVFVKTIFNRPELNRFVQGHRLYERNYVSITFAAKDKMSDQAEEKMIVLKINPEETALQLARKMAFDIFETRKKGTNELDKILKRLTKMPRFILRLVTNFIKWLDYHGWVPKYLSENDSNYATLLLSNLGSIKSNSCYHHLNNYGTNSICITIGTIKEENNRFIVDIGATLDERISDGFYFAKSLKLAQYICSNPKVLEQPLKNLLEIENNL